MTEGEKWDCASFAACNSGRKATVVKYTADTLVLKVEDHPEKDSELKSVSFSFDASSLAGSAFGPEMPALVIRRSMWDSFLEISATRFSSDSLEVTSQGLMLYKCQLKGCSAMGDRVRTGLCFLFELESGLLPRSRALWHRWLRVLGLPFESLVTRVDKNGKLNTLTRFRCLHLQVLRVSAA
jgi:hypothetical protein